MRRSQAWQSTALLLLLLTFGADACKKKTVVLPPPPSIPPVAAANNQPPPTTPPCVAPTVRLTANTQTVTQGGAVTISWVSTNATTVDIQPGIGSVTPVAGANRQVNPASSVTYAATATGPCGSAGDTLRITVNAAPPPAVVAPNVNRGNNQQPPPQAPILTSQQIFDRDMKPINFDYDKSDIREDQKSKLQTAAAYLKSTPAVRVTIEGHADERGSEEYNLALGDRRANAVKQYLISQGIVESRLSTVSYGEERPICSAQTEDCYSQNRRAAFKN